MTNFMKQTISIVIPCRDDDCLMFRLTLDAIACQILQPEELIIIDSSANNAIENTCDAHGLNNIISYQKISPAFAGLSTNVGIKSAKGNLIALLDTKTLPAPDWLETYRNFLYQNGVDAIFGSTTFSYKTNFQRAVRAASYGSIAHETVPGSLFYKEVGIRIPFKENLRAAYDLDWKIRLRDEFKTFTPMNSFVSYSQFPSSIFSLVKKYFIYSFYTGMTVAQKSLKDIYFSIALVVTALIIPNWNLMLPGWDQNPLYIPDVTKKYFLLLTIFLLLVSLVSLISKQELESSLWYKTLKYIIYILVFYFVFSWNAEIALWVEDAVLYVPHITKIFLLIIITLSISYRGIIKPIQKKEDLSYLFPFQWLAVGVIGLIMDIAKAPGFIFGSLLGRLRQLSLIK
jgi:hypothetical protein